MEELMIPQQQMFGEDVIHVRRLCDFQFNAESSSMPHRHSFFMVLWCTEGLGSHFIDFKRYDIAKGRVFLLQPGQVHEMVSYPRDGYMILFEDRLLGSFLAEPRLREMLAVFDRFSIQPFIDLDEELFAIFEHLFSQLMQQDDNFPIDHTLMMHYVTLLLSHIERYRRRHYGEIAENKHYQLIHNFRVLLEKNFIERRHIDWYSKQLHVDYERLNRAIQFAYGKSLYQVICGRLVLECKTLLLGTDLSMKEIAFHLNFQNQSNFGRFFKHAMGMSPSAFRRANDKLA